MLFRSNKYNIVTRVSAAKFKPMIEGLKWTSSDTVTVTFSDNVTLADVERTSRIN